MAIRVITVIAPKTFTQTWPIGGRVREVASPNRLGTITNVHGTGNFAKIFVHLDGRPITVFAPSQLLSLS